MAGVFSAGGAVADGGGFEVLGRAIVEEGCAEADGRAAGGGEGELTVPDGIFSACGVTDDGVVRAQYGRDADGDMRAAIGWGVVGPMKEERAGEEIFVPGTDESVGANCAGNWPRAF